MSAFNYGAKKYGRVRKGFYFTLTAGEVLLGAIAVIGMFFPAQLVAVFQKDPEVVAIGEGALRVQLVALFFQPMTVCANMMFQSIWKNGRATLLAMLRNLMLYSEKRLTVRPKAVSYLSGFALQRVAVRKYKKIPYATALYDRKDQ